MAADPNNSVFFPATWIYLLRPFSAAVRSAFALWAVGLPLLAFAGLRGLRLSAAPAAVAAAAIGVCGPAMTLACLPSSGWAVALFFPFLALLARGSGRDVLAAGIVLGVAILAGEPALALEIFLLGSLFAISVRGADGFRRTAFSLGGAALLGAFVAAPQIAGAAQLLGQTVRASGLPVASGAAFYSVAPPRVIALLWPGFFGDVMSPERAGFWGRAFFDAGAPYIYSLALGSAALALVPAALRDRLGRRFLLLAAFAATASLGRFLPGGPRLLSIPGLSFLRYPEKWLFFAGLCTIGAAAVSLERLRTGDRAAIRAAAAGAAGLTGLSLLVAALLFAFPGASVRVLTQVRVIAPELADSSASILAAIRSDVLLVGAYALVALATVFLGRARPHRIAWAFSFLILAELFLRNWNSLPLAPKSFYDTPPAAAQAARLVGGRVDFDRETEVSLDPLRPMRPVVWGLSFAGNNDIDRFSPRRSFVFALDLSRLSFSDPRKAALLRLADVHAVSSTDPGAARSPGFEPLAGTSPGRTLARLGEGRRARVVFAARVASGESEARSALADPAFDPESEAILEGAAPPLAAEGFGRVSTVELAPDGETVDANVSSPALLVRSETYDPHWSAQLDGRAARLLPADFAFQAVAIPPGRHRITFQYRNPLILWGMFVSLATLFGCAAALRRIG